MSETSPGFGVYIHWPFCAQKCPYCDFNSHVRLKGPDQARFLAAYRRELDHAAAVVGRESVVTSIFIGGGTPSLMEPATVAGLLDHVAGLWSVASDAEVTLEANPGSVEASRFAGYRAAGVNRVSLGVQSLRDAELRRLGRVHSAAEARAAIDIAQRTFTRMSFDLIYARPGQSVAEWRQELGEALAMAGEHLSLYQLTIEPETTYAALYAAGKLVVPDTDEARVLYDVTQEIMERAGLPAYEISNHARPGGESRHNLTYWRYGSYVGVGAGAHGRLVRADDGTRLATATQRNPEAWLAAVETCGHGMVEESVLSKAEQADEMLLMGLRIREGIDLKRLQRETGLAPHPAAVEKLVREALIVGDALPGRAVATATGRAVLDQVVTQLSEHLVPVTSRHLPAA